MIRRHALAAVVVAVSMLVGGLLLVVGPDGHAGAYRRPAPPPPKGVFKTGGVPLPDAGVERVLAHALPQLVMTSVAVTGKPTDEAQRGARVAALRDEPALARFGDDWRGMIDALDRWMVLSPGERGYRAGADELRARIDRMSDRFADAELGYYIDPEILTNLPRARAGIFSYRIEQVSFVLADDDKMRVLSVRRIDHVATETTALGMTEELGEPVVLLDAIDDKVEHQLLPVLAGYAYPLGDGGSRLAARAAGDAIRHELIGALGLGIDRDRARARLQKLVAASIRHHEAQHAFDRGSELRHPKQLAAVLPDKAETTFAMRARHELSAYTSQIASDTWLPQLVLWNLARQAFRADSRSEEMYVALVVVDGLARQLKLSARPLMRGGRIDHEAVLAVLEQLARVQTIELRSAAARLWAELFGEKLVRMIDA